MPTNKDNIEVFKRVKTGDYYVVPFEVNKSYTFNDSYPTSSGYFILKCIAPQRGVYRRDIPPLGNNSYTSITGSSNVDSHVAWYSTRHNFYNGSTEEDYNSTYFYMENSVRNLYESASVASIPQSKFGKKIKKGSVVITDYSGYGVINCIDDSNYNIIDVDIPTESLLSNDNLLCYYGFNDKYFYNNLTDYNRHTCIDGSKYNNNANIYGDINFIPGIYTHGNYITRSGYMASMIESSSIEIEATDYLNFSMTDDFCVSMWIDIPSTQKDLSSDKNYIVSKRVKNKKTTYNRFTNRQELLFGKYNESVYPFDMYIYNENSSFNGKIGFNRVGGTGETYITSSTILTGSQHHIVFQKSGSYIELYVDGNLDYQVIDGVNGKIENDSNLYIGSLGNNQMYLSGSIDEFRIYDKSLDSQEILYLYNNDYSTGSAYQSNVIGNVFYERGIIVISDPRPKYRYMLLNSGDDGFDITYKATETIHEHNIVCSVDMRDFNVSLNPSTLENAYSDTGIVKDSVYSDDFSPYITTIGFYDDNYDLIAIGKFARPIKKRSDVNITFVCRFDN